MTSNLGSEFLANLGEHEDVDSVRGPVMDAGAGAFPAGVPQPARRHHPLPPAEAQRHGGHRRHPARAALERLLEERKITLDLDQSAREWLADKGYDPVYGARPLKRVIQREVQDPLADKMLAGEVPEGARVKITGGTDKLLFLPRVTGGKAGKAA